MALDGIDDTAVASPSECANEVLIAPVPAHCSQLLLLFSKKVHAHNKSDLTLPPHQLRSTLLDDFDCFDTLKSQTYQWHEFITLLFQGLRDPFKVVLKRASCQNRFLCDVIERKRTPILSCCHLAAITMRLGTVSGPSCGTAESVIFEGHLL